MKKKIVLVAILLALILVCLAACNGDSATLSKINDLLDEYYSVITVNVTTETSQVTLHGNFVFTFSGSTTGINYSYEKLNDLNLDGNNEDEYVTKVEGSAIVRIDGSVTTDDGEVLDLPLTEYDLLIGLNFKQAFLAHTKVSDGKLEADVTNPKGFTGNSQLVCSDMHVVVEYSADALSEITLTYVSESGADVAITYLFTK